MVLADARPQLEGQATLKRLIKRGIPTTYILLNSLSCLISVRLISLGPMLGALNSTLNACCPFALLVPAPQP